MYTATIGSIFGSLEEMLTWCNGLPGTEVEVDGIQPGIVDFVRSVSISLDQNGKVICVVVVNLKEMDI